MNGNSADVLQEITPKPYIEGRVQGLRFINGDGKIESVGVILPGLYDFGRHK